VRRRSAPRHGTCGVGEVVPGRLPGLAIRPTVQEVPGHRGEGSQVQRHQTRKLAPNLDSISLGEEISSDHRWRRRWELLGDGRAGATTTCALLRARDQSSAWPSLGLGKPDVADLLVEPNDAFDADKQALAELAASENLLQDAKAVLEPAPYRLTYRYHCRDESTCTGAQADVHRLGGRRGPPLA